MSFRDVDELASHRKSHEVRGREDEVPGSDNPHEKESGTDYENGFMDPPGTARVASGARAEAKRDADPDKASEFAEADQSHDTH